MLSKLTSRVQTKIITVFLAALLLPILVLVIYNTIVVGSTTLENARIEELNKLNLQAAQIEAYLSRVSNQLFFLSESPVVRDYATATASGGSADVTAIEQTFASFSENLQIYDQVRLLDAQGREVVRVNYADGHSVVVPSGELQDQSSRPYFSEAMLLPSGGLYVSPLNLNRERGEIEQPYKPVIRYATPVYTDAGSVGGVVVLNVLAQPFLDFVKRTAEDATVYLLDSDGTYLAGPDPALLFGRDFENEVIFASNNPKDAALLFEATAEETLTNSLDEPDQLTTHTHISPEGQEGAINWTLLVQRPVASVMQGANEQRLVVIVVGLLAAVITGSALYVVTSNIVRPIRDLAVVTTAVASGKRDVTVPTIKTRDEVGQLAESFQEMLGELNTAYREMEARVHERTADLAATLEVGSLASRLLDPTELLPRSVEYILERFELDYVQIYLLDDAKRYAYLRAGTGEVGRDLLGISHRLDMNETSLVSTVVRTGQTVLVGDTETSSIHKKNSRLPDTRSEMVVPMTAGTEILGVLDLQSNIKGKFHVDNQSVFEAMGFQLASVIRSARAFEQARTAVQHADGINQRLTHEDWNEYLGKAKNGRPVGYQYDLEAPTPLEDGLQLVTTETGIVQPIRLRGQQIGQIVVGEDGDRVYSDVERLLVQEVADRVAQAAEQLRAFSRIKESRDEIEQTLKTVADIRRALDESAIVAITDQTGKLEYVNDQFCAISEYSREELIGQDHRMVNSGYHTKEFIRNVWVTIANGGVWQGEFKNRAKSGREYWVATTIVPFLNESGKPYQYIAIRHDITERKRGEEEITRRAAELETVAQVSTAATTLLNVDALLAEVVDLTKSRFNLYHAHVYLLDEAGNNLVLAAGAGETGRTMKARGHRIPLNREHSLVARAGRTQQSVIANRIADEPDFLPNPLLPQTRAELAVPMVVNNQLVGVLDVQADTADRFTEADARVKATLAAQIAVAVQNARQYEAAQRRAEDLRANAEIAALLRVEGDQQSMLEKVSNVIFETFKPASVVISNYLAMKDEWHGYVGVGGGVTSEIAQSFVDPGAAYPHGMEAIRTQKVVLVENTHTYPDFPQVYIDQLGLQSVMVIPMVVNRESTGVIFLNFTKAHRFSAQELEFANSLANQLSSGLERRQAELSLAQERNLLRALIDNLPDHIYVKDREGRFVGGNTAVVHHLGVNSLDEMIGKTDFDFHPHDLAQVYHANEQEMMRQGQHLMDYEQEVINHDTGTRAWVLTTKVPVFDQDGNVSLLVGMNRDITERKKAEEALRDSEKRYADIANSMPGAIFQFSATEGNWRMDYISAGIEAIAGVTPAAIMADVNMLINRFHPDDVPLFVDSVTEVVATLEPWAFEGRLYTNDGELRWWQGRSQPSISEDGRAVFNGVLLDITDRKRAEQEIQKRASELETVARVSATAAATLDVDKLLNEVVELTKQQFSLYHVHVYLLNETGDTLLLAAGAGEAGRLMMERGHKVPVSREHSLVALVARTHRSIIANDVVSEENFMPNPLLPETRSEMALPMIVNTVLIGVLDVQSEKVGRFTAEDVRVKSTLADQIAVAVQNARQYQQQVATAEQLRAVDRLKSEFLANMSHELRTPLNSIIGYAEMMLDGVDGELSEEAVEDVQAIHGGGQHLLAIINDILDLAKIEAGQMRIDPQEVDIARFIHEIVRSGQVLIKNKPVVLNTCEDQAVLPAFVDPIRLRQIVWNLVSNAVKFTEQGSVEVHYGMRGDAHVYVSVRDTGVGISQENLPVVFEQFRQVDGSSTRRAGGTGLGLTITRHLVRLHGGEIQAESTPGKGSNFWFTLPLYKSQ